MKFKINNKYFKWGLTAFLVVAGGILFYYLLFYNSNIVKNFKGLINIVMPVVFGLIIAYLLTPIMNWIERRVLVPLMNLMKIKESKTRKKWIRAISVIATSLIMIFSIYILIAMLVSQIVPSIQNIVKDFDTYISNFSSWLDSLLEDNQELKSFILPQVDKFTTELEKWLADTATLLAKSSEVLKTVSLSIISFLKTTWNFIIGFIISIYVLFSKETFSAQGKKMIYAIFEKDSANHVLTSLRFVHKTFIGFISGKILDSIIIGILCFIGTSLMHTPYSVLISVIVGVTNVIPFFGPYLGAIPCALLLILVDLSNPMTCVAFLIFILVLQQLDGNVIGPKILGESTGLSGFWVIFAITVFGGMLGVFGMIIGVPIFAIFFALVKHLVNKSLNKKKMPLDSNIYLTLDKVDEETGEIHVLEPEPKKKRSTKKEETEAAAAAKALVKKPIKAIKKKIDQTRNKETENSTESIEEELEQMNKKDEN